MNKYRSEILCNAAETGDLWLLTYDGGPRWVRAGKADLGDDTDRGNQALYVDELRAMERENLVEYGGGEYYRLTGAGFTAAKQESNRTNLQKTSTSELVEVVRRQAESYQKPDPDIWNELMARYLWFASPKEDKVLISNLDPLLRPLNNGYTMLPPGAIPVPGAGIPPPPPYYKNKVTLSQATNALLPPAAKLPATTDEKPADRVVSASPKAENNLPPPRVESKEKPKPPATPMEAWMGVLWDKPLGRFFILLFGLLAVVAALYGIFVPENAKEKIWAWLLKFL